MRKYIYAAALLMMSLCFGETLSAGNFGVLGGGNFQTYAGGGNGSGTLTQWHAGISYKINLPIGFQLQPALLYNVKSSTAENVPLGLSVGYLELLASMQWGIDLILFRPYVEVCPFAGYGLNGKGALADVWKKDRNRWEYGVGVGGGLQIWRFQLGARYNWNFAGAKPEGADFNGVTLSLAYFF